MPMDPSTQALFEGSVRLGVFFRLSLGTPLRLWLGVNEVPARIENIDNAGATYIGAGKLINVPDLDVLINGIADRVDFTMSGVPVDLSNNLEVGAPSIVGKALRIAIAALDERWQVPGYLIPVWHGKADYWAVRQAATSDPKSSPTRTIILSASSGDTGRSRSRRVTFTSAQQKLRYPTDQFCDRVPRYTREYQVSWPRF